MKKGPGSVDSGFQQETRAGFSGPTTLILGEIDGFPADKVAYYAEEG